MAMPSLPKLYVTCLQKDGKCQNTLGPAEVLASQPWKEGGTKYTRQWLNEAAPLSSLLSRAYSVKMQPLAKWLMKVWWPAFCLTPATEQQPCRAAIPKQNVTTWEDQKTWLKEAGSQAAEDLTTPRVGCTTPRVTWSPKHGEAAVAVLKTEPPLIPAPCATRLSEVPLQI